MDFTSHSGLFLCHSLLVVDANPQSIQQISCMIEEVKGKRIADIHLLEDVVLVLKIQKLLLRQVERTDFDISHFQK